MRNVCLVLTCCLLLISGNLEARCSIPDLVITSPPQNAEICAGESASFSITATTATGTLSYDWQYSPNGGLDWFEVGDYQSSPIYNVPGPIGIESNGYIYRVTVRSDNNTPSDLGDDCLSTGGMATLFLLGDVINTTTITCDPSQVGVVSDTFTNQFNCDSVITVTTVLSDTIPTLINATTCDPSQVGVATDTFTNQFNCDSVVTVTTVLSETIPTLNIIPNATLCPGGNPLLTLTVTEGNACNTQWQVSTTSQAGPFTNVPSATGPTLDTGPIFVTSHYRVTATSCGASCPAVSNVITVSIVDPIPPTAICKLNYNISLDVNGTYTLLPSEIDSASTDNCGINRLELSKTSFTCSDIGVETVTLSVIDNLENTSTCQTQVNVVDAGAPIAVCQNVTVNLNSAGIATITPSDVDNGSSDQCGSIGLTLDVNSFTCADVGGYPVKLTVTDESGNTTDCHAEVVLRDLIPPTAVCRTDTFTIALDAAGTATLMASDIDAGSSDNCAIVDYSTSVFNLTCAEIGTYTVDLIVYDADNNSGTCSAWISVVDTIPPAASCQDITVYTDAAGNVDGFQVSSNDFLLELTDNCIANLSYSVPNNLTCADIGINVDTVTVLFTDNSNNSSICSFGISVADTIPPTASCQDVTVYLNSAGFADITPSDVENSSADNCGIDFRSLDDDDFDCGDLAGRTVTLTVDDFSGNSSQCTAQVTVLDTIPPTAVCSDLTIAVGAIGVTGISTPDIVSGSSDNCAILGQNISLPVVTCSDVGTVQVVTATITDASNNSSQCTANITVIDTIPPTAVCQDITVQLDVTGSVNIQSTDVDGGSSDNCGIVSSVVFPDGFDCTELGAQTVTLTVTDAEGNQDNCISNVEVQGEDVILDPNDPATLCLNGAAVDLTANASPAGGVFNGPGISGNLFNPFVAGIGDHEIVYTYTFEKTCANSDTITISVDQCTGLSAEELFGDVVLVPNPTSSSTQLNFYLQSGVDLEVDIFDAAGKLYGRYADGYWPMGSHSLRLDVGHLAAGNYYIRILSDDAVGYKKLIKLK